MKIEFYLTINVESYEPDIHKLLKTVQWLNSNNIDYVLFTEDEKKG